MRIIWLYGAPGVGKSTIAWAATNRLADLGKRVATIDIDQLGMVYPQPEDGTWADELKGDALAVVAREFARRGISTLVVSGVMAPDFRDAYRRILSGHTVTFIRLTAPDATLRARLATRGQWAPEWDDVAADLDELAKAGLTDPAVSTENVTPGEAANAVLDAESHAADVPVDNESPEDPVPVAAQTHATGSALLICGTPLVGKSQVAWQAFMRLRAAGITTAFVDVRQVGFVGRDGGIQDHELQARMVGELWRLFRTRGATQLLLNGTIDDDSDTGLYAEALGETPLRSVRLVADARALARRIRARIDGDGPLLAGDTLRGASDEEFDAALADATMRQANIRGGFVPIIDTSALDVVEVAAQVWSAAV